MSHANGAHREATALRGASPDWLAALDEHGPPLEQAIDTSTRFCAYPVAMDLHNNEVGREIAATTPDASPQELAALVEQAVKDGRMVVIDQNDTLVPSNEVNPGETHDTPNKQWPTDNPDRGDDHDPGEPSATPEQY
ncbi:DUF6973 domain-containing protein [Actinokineospora fastidiosa]|uniref:DUF6973 domain-containing protein n=1 Tax=Actinokineospora fastidiosa TaxID=1816 RepID=UPI001E5854B5|nr:hypothetical protein [Actinokineospora fastidiosa]